MKNLSLKFILFGLVASSTLQSATVGFIVALSSFSTAAQTTKIVELPSETYFDEGISHSMPYPKDIYRTIESGSKFITSYSENCP